MRTAADSSSGPEKGLHSAIVDTCTVSRASGCRRNIDGIELAMLCLYDRKDVLEVASSHDSFVQLNLDRRGPATSAMIVARGWAEPLPDLASPTQEWSPIVFWRFTDAMAALLIAPGILRAPIVALAQVGTRIGGSTT